jgi:hypothetical protein
VALRVRRGSKGAAWPQLVVRRLAVSQARV